MSDMTTFALATALTAEETRLFEHGVALAAAASARLVTVSAQNGADSQNLPDASTILDGWGRGDSSVKHDAMLHTCCEDPVDTLLDAVRRLEPDLLIAGTHQRKGAARIVAGSQCEALLRNVARPTLVFPLHARSFVDDKGTIALDRVVIPVGDEASAAAAASMTVWLAEKTGVDNLTIELLHVGDAADMPAVPTFPATFDVQIRNVEGDITKCIADATERASLLVMSTRGPDSLKDALFGTNTEKVLRHVACPVLIAPLARS